MPRGKQSGGRKRGPKKGSQRKGKKPGPKKGRKQVKVIVVQQPHGSIQGGDGIGDVFKKVVSGVKSANQFAKDNRVVSKLKGVTDALGATGYIDSKTGGQFSNLTGKAIQAGYNKQGGRGAFIV